MITIYEANASDFTTLGLGALAPSECVVEEKAGGLYDMTLTQPISEDCRHTLLRQMRIIKAPAPVRETPILTMSKTQQTVQREIYKVDTDGRRLYLRAAPDQNSKGLHAYKEGTEVVLLEKTTSQWYHVAIVEGGASGYMWAGNLVFVRTENELVESDAPSVSVKVEQARDQLFRIVEVEPDTRERAVRVRARHITYDLVGAVVTGEYAPEAVAAHAACAQMAAQLDHDISPFTVHCAVSDPVSGDYGGRNLLDCLLDPETGIAAQTHARVIRDNYDIYLLPDEERDRGAEIRYGKNLLAGSMRTDASGIVTRIRPAGKDKDGDPLYIEENNGYVDSARLSEYPVIYAKEIQYDVVEGRDDMTKEEARSELKSRAQAEFEAGCDLPDVSLDADFVRLELTDQYRDMANAYALHMYDTAKVVARDAGIAASVRMVGYKYDCLMNRYSATVLGDISETQASVFGYEISGGLQGSKIALNSLNGDRIRNLSVGYGKFTAAAIDQLSADAITAIRADVRELVAGNITTDQLYADIAQIAKAEIDSAVIDAAQIENLTAEIARITQAEIENAVIDKAQIKDLDVEIADIAKAEIGVADIDWAHIKDLATDTAIITQGVGGRLFISRLAVTEANMVSLTVGELVVKGEDGSFYAVSVGANGQITTTLKQIVNDDIGDLTINAGEKLIEGSVTAATLNATDIFADSAIIRELIAANMRTDTFFARQAVISELDAYIVRASTIQALQGSLSIWADDKITLAVGDIENNVDALGNRVSAAETSLTLKADQATLTSKADELQAQIDLVPGQIELAVSQVTGDYVSQSVFQQTVDSIELSVSGKLDADGAARAVDTLSGITINQQGIYMTGGEISLSTQSEDGYINITPDGVNVGKAYAGNVAVRYDGASWINVDPSATDAQVSSGGYVRSLADALAMVNGRVLDYDVRFELKAGLTEYGNLQISGITGRGILRIIGNSSSRATLYGKIDVKQCGVRVYVWDLNVICSNDTAVNVNACAYFEGMGMLIKSASANAFAANEGACFSLRYVTLVAGSSGNYAGYVLKSIGDLEYVNGTGAFISYKSHVTAEGTVPAGGIQFWGCPEPNNISNLTPTGPDGSTPSAPTTYTTSYNATGTDSYAGGWSYFDDNDVRQGYVGRTVYGCMWFGSLGLSGRIVLQATLSIYMQGGYGRGVAVDVELYGTGKAYSSSLSGTPNTGTISYGVIGRAEPGQVNELTIPTSAVTALANGSIQGLMLRSSDSAFYKDRDYSKNYARFDGVNGTKPKLTVVYQ